MSDQPEQKPKIVVDDDWKAQVEAERKSAGEKQAETQAEAELPPASFTTLLQQLTAQALACLGQMPGPDGKREVRLDIARHTIDTLGVLEEKTSGNLTEEESAMLTQLLYELRMAYVAVNQGGQTSGPEEDPPESPIITP